MSLSTGRVPERRAESSKKAGKAFCENCMFCSDAVTREIASSNDWVIRYEGGNLQLKPGSRRYGPTRSKALVCEWEDGTMKVYYRVEAIAFTELKKQPQKASAPLPPRARPVVVRKAKKDHPWRQSYQTMRTPIPKEQIGAPLVGMRTYASP